MNLPAPFHIRRFVSASLLVVGLVLPPAVRAASSDRDDGARLLQAALPTGLLIRQADCDHVVRAVRAATLAHHRAAESILSAALASGEGTDRRAAGAKWTCPCVVRIFRTAANSAPDHAGALLETAEALYPDCADGLTEALHGLDDKNVVVGALQTDSKDAGGAYGPAGASNVGEAGTPGSAGTAVNPDGTGDPGDPNAPTASGLSTRNFQGLDLADPGTGDTTGSAGANPSANGFANGFGAGFPGAPGFSGSTPGGGTALPLPVATAVTPGANG